MSTTVQFDDNNNDGSFTVVIETPQAPRAAGDFGSWTPQLVSRLLLRVGFMTLLMDVATAIHTPPWGVVFQHHEIAYYLTLAGIFAAGVIEYGTALCLSTSSGQANGRLVSFARAVLWVSVGPLVTIISLGGFSVLLKI